MKTTTNVKPRDLNYDRYGMDKYDKDIINSIPFHEKLHAAIASFVKQNFHSKRNYEILDLGVGTGITSRLMQRLLPAAHLDVVDFSKQMMRGAKKKLGTENVNYILGDYATLRLPKRYDIIVSVIGIHHQNTEGKQRLFKKIYSLLKPGGIFIFGDLMTYRNKSQAAYNNALHYHHLVEKSADKKTLEEWAYHHQYLNDLAPVEDQISWLKKDGFNVSKLLQKMNTVLLVCKKSKKS